MHKKIIVITIIAILIVTGCNSNKKQMEKYEGDTTTDITMTIKDGTLTNTSATVIIKDESGEKNLFTKAFQLFKKINNEWIQLEFIKDNVTITTENYLVDENNVLELELGWDAYGELSAGEYKIVKHAENVNNDKSYFFSTDFVIS